MGAQTILITVPLMNHIDLLLYELDAKLQGKNLCMPTLI
jgi:hypothetical protein